MLILRNNIKIILLLIANINEEVCDVLYIDVSLLPFHAKSSKLIQLFGM